MSLHKSCVDEHAIVTSEAKQLLDIFLRNRLSIRRDKPDLPDGQAASSNEASKDESQTRLSKSLTMTKRNLRSNSSLSKDKMSLGKTQTSSRERQPSRGQSLDRMLSNSNHIEPMEIDSDDNVLQEGSAWKSSKSIGQREKKKKRRNPFQVIRDHIHKDRQKREELKRYEMARHAAKDYVDNSLEKRPIRPSTLQHESMNSSPVTGRKSGNLPSFSRSNSTGQSNLYRLQSCNAQEQSGGVIRRSQVDADCTTDSSVGSTGRTTPQEVTPTMTFEKQLSLERMSIRKKKLSRSKSKINQRHLRAKSPQGPSILSKLFPKLATLSTATKKQSQKKQLSEDMEKEKFELTAQWLDIIATEMMGQNVDKSVKEQLHERIKQFELFSTGALSPTSDRDFAENFHLRSAFKAKVRKFKTMTQQDDLLTELSRVVSYETFAEIVSKMVGVEPGWKQITFLYYLTRKTVRLIDTDSDQVEVIKQFTLTFFQTNYSHWVEQNGGWRAVVEQSEDSDVD